MKHSNIMGSSTAARRYHCPGSIDLEDKVPEPEESSYAAEGTALHSAMEWILDTNAMPGDTRGMEFYGCKITDERVGLLQYCLDAFMEVVGDAEFDLEKTLAFPGVEGAFGTGDVLYYGDGTAGIMDWKFGAGVPVHTPGNMQAKFLLCALRASSDEVAASTRLYATFVQPRLDYVETCEFTHAELDAFEADIHHALTHRRYSENPYGMGSHCRWCKAILICPAQAARRNEFLQMKEIANDVGSILDAAKEIEATIKAAREMALRTLEAGAEVPGYKLVQKLGNRKWKDEDLTDHWLSKQGVTVHDRRKVVLKSPAQIEKLRPDLKDRLANRIDRAEGVAVAPESDKREAILTGEALDKDFGNLLDTLGKAPKEGK